jgi:hypothetical protein
LLIPSDPLPEAADHSLEQLAEDTYWIKFETFLRGLLHQQRKEQPFFHLSTCQEPRSLNKNPRSNR